MSPVDPSQDEKRNAVSRRDFLRVGGLSVVGLSVAEQAAAARQRSQADRRSVILIQMTGGASHLETFDPKPEAPVEIRGPLKAISTAVTGVVFSESLPMLAERAEKLAVVRSLYHDAAAIHETGQQLLQSGRLSQRGVPFPSFGSLVARFRGPRDGVAPYVVLPRLSGYMGVHAIHGQGAGFLGEAYAPFTQPASDCCDDPAIQPVGSTLFAEPELLHRSYGNTRFGRLCLAARQMVECGVRAVTVNLFDNLANQVTWDCHGRQSSSPGSLYDYRDTLCPQFDRAVAALVDDLEQRGLLNDTLVVAVGEFGRTPRINHTGGRDHWPHVWSGLVAGGGVAGGQVIGASDRYGTEPVDRPVHLAELTATMYRSLGFDPAMPVPVNPQTPVPLVEHASVAELFA